MRVFDHALRMSFFSFAEEQPVFLETVANVTVALGRDASLTCVVDKLGSHKVNSYKLMHFMFRYLDNGGNKYIMGGRINKRNRSID